MAVLTAFNLAAHLPATFTAPGLSEERFLALCEGYPDCMLEYTSEGTVIVMPPTDPENSAKVAEVLFQLMNWSKAKRPGIVTGPDVGFFLPDGSRRSSDVAWFDSGRWQSAKTPGTRFPVFLPDFVIEVRSPFQRASAIHEKMEEYIANGVHLAWLIDPFAHTVTIYRPGQDPEVLPNRATVSGDGPVEGFILSLDGIL